MLFGNNTEKQYIECPTFIRSCCKAGGNSIINTALLSSISSLILVIPLMIDIGTGKKPEVFWVTFILNFVVSFIQAWFLIAFIKLVFKFVKIWKKSHPIQSTQSPSLYDDEEEKAKDTKCCICCCKMCFYIFCCGWLILLIACCNKKKENPNDDGQDEFGVNYKEYIAWKNNQNVVDRKLPKSYITKKMEKRRTMSQISQQSQLTPSTPTTPTMIQTYTSNSIQLSVLPVQNNN